MSEIVSSWGIALPLAITFTGLFFLFLFASIFLGIVDDVLSILDLELGGGLYLLSFMTISGILGGVSMGAWTYLYMESSTNNPLLYSFIVGLVALIGTGVLKKAIFSAGSTSSLPDFKVEVGDVGTVYLEIEPNGVYGGQATFTDKYHRTNQVSVLTSSDESISNGRQVIVVDIKGTNSSPIIYVSENI